MAFRSIDVAEYNQQTFNTALREAAATVVGGMEKIQVWTADETVEYSSLDNRFFRSIDLGGYRRDSLVGMDFLSSDEETELYRKIGEGFAEINVVTLSAYGSGKKRVWHGEFNFVRNK